MMERKRLAIVGGGAAGFFAAIQAKAVNPHNEVIVLESSGKVLSKVRISGGGRCNVTHACFDPAELVSYYPRGGKELRQAFSRFMTGDTVDWFESRGVELKIEEDGRMFPVSDNSASVVNCLTTEANRAGVELKLHTQVKSIVHHGENFSLITTEESQLQFDRVLIATGGMMRETSSGWLKALGHTIAAPVPSLFTFNLPGHPLNALMGVSVKNAHVHLDESDMETNGPLLITHWGMSGPAVLKLSAWAARDLYERKYDFNVYVNWCNGTDIKDYWNWFDQCRKQHGHSKVKNTPFPELPKRLWEFLIDHAGISDRQNWSDLRKDQLDRLASALHRFEVNVSGKTTFKEEFVTCGGIALNEVDFKTMQSKRVSGLFFAGEVLDIDGLTGGFNFQAAWTTGYIAGSAMAV
jgi:predicted Rossmann fold flavoprotein